jgi:hypothetical protein
MQLLDTRQLSLRDLEDVTGIPRLVFWFAADKGQLRHQFVRTPGRKPEIRVSLEDVNAFLRDRRPRGPFFPQLRETLAGDLEVVPALRKRT